MKVKKEVKPSQMREKIQKKLGRLVEGDEPADSVAFGGFLDFGFRGAGGFGVEVEGVFLRVGEVVEGLAGPIAGRAGEEGFEAFGGHLRGEVEKAAAFGAGHAFPASQGVGFFEGEGFEFTEHEGVLSFRFQESRIKGGRGEAVERGFAGALSGRGWLRGGCSHG